MSFVSVCKNVIGRNNKRNWENPEPAIRVSNTPCGRVVDRGHSIAIKDAAGNVVARMVSTTDGKPVISCGAKVALITEFPVEVVEEGEGSSDGP